MQPILPTEHVCFAGMTGSGKTTLAKRYLIGFRNVVIIDPKWTFKWPEAETQGLLPIYHSLDTMMRKLGSGRAIYRPGKNGLQPEEIDRLYGWLLDRGETVAYTDEQYAVTPRGRISENQKGILTRGRELGVVNWTATQRPAWIPLFCISEATHIFAFRLRLASDRKTMAGVMGESVINNPPGKHGFFYSHETWEEPVLIPHGIKL